MRASASAAAPIRAVWPGRPFQLGATWDGEGVNFALFTEHAGGVELCLFDRQGRRELQRIALTECTDDVWHCYLPEARPGLLYGYRVHGPYDPERGHRFNANKLLLDPYARNIAGSLRWSDALFGYSVGHRRQDLSFDRRDSASGMPKAKVIDPAFTWGEDRRPDIPWSDLVICELHVRGYTIAHPEVPPALRGTYAGLASAPVIDHLRRLGVNAVELMPVHAFVHDRPLIERGLRNYWGYNTIGYFAPEPYYSASGSVSEFKTMVRGFHSAGIEVILDVVYNHTAEGNEFGPTLAFRGIDNAAYYRLEPEAPRRYQDYTGCGNTLNMQHPRVLQLIMDSLRYWAAEMHVDGFRFDLASALARELNAVNRLGAFFDIIRQDPLLSRLKLIAEPWDLGEGGYQVGNFPLGWAEWNDKYRDAMRGWWKGDAGLIGEFSSRLSGSSDLYGASGRRPYSSVNFVTCHDGFTLHDLVSYNHKHNEPNFEANRDGHDHNLAWNCGVEGPTSDPQIRALRERQKRNLLATLLLSQGVPMLLAGDELGRSQGGNNNAYCQDNPGTWQNWEVDEDGRRLLAFVQRLIGLRRAHPLLHRRDFFRGQPPPGAAIKDILWLSPGGEEMTEELWKQGYARCLGVYLNGEGLTEIDTRGRHLTDASLLLLFNAHHEDLDFALPALPPSPVWRRLLDTSRDEIAAGADGKCYPAPGPYPLAARSLAVLEQLAPGSAP
jgi:isoamylase